MSLARLESLRAVRRHIVDGSGFAAVNRLRRLCQGAYLITAAAESHRLAGPALRACPLDVPVRVPEVAKEPQHAHTEDTAMQTGMMRLRELTVRYAVRKDHEGQPIVVGRELGSPRETASALMTALQDQPGEVFAILCVSTKLRVIAYHEVSRGTLDATLVHPREVFKAALLANAAAIILTHNHPSGDPIPSADDVQLTRRLVDAGALLGVEVLDHIIVGDGRYYSFKECGRL
jgi:DNA repair protein RadC